MRLFVALNLRSDQKAALAEVLAPLRGSALPVRWVDPASVHLTLKFLGEVAEPALEEMGAAVARAARVVPPFTAAAHGLGGFPDLRRPRVLWLGLDAGAELQALQAAVEAELGPLGYPPENRPFSPHLTVGRARQGARAADFATLADLVGRFRFEATLDARTVDLMRSRLSPRGARYERLLAAPLGEGEG